MGRAEPASRRRLSLHHYFFNGAALGCFNSRSDFSLFRFGWFEPRCEVLHFVGVLVEPGFDGGDDFG